MKEFIIPPLMINFIFFIMAIILGANPGQVTLSMPGGYVFQINYALLLAGVIGISIAIALSSIQVLGSGLGDAGVRIIKRCVVYFGIWALLSSYSYSFLGLLPTFGIIIYTVLTIMYAIGVFIGVGDDSSISGGIKETVTQVNE